METLKYSLGFVVFLALALVLVDFLKINTEPVPAVEEPVATTTNSQTVSTPEITFEVPPDFGLAVTSEQILIKSYIPACDSEFDYCLYYNGTALNGTNFDSAGLRIKRRTDLDTRDLCLSTNPVGYTDLETETKVFSTYATSKFGPVGDAGAGHYASGEVYRLTFDQTCYEFETRIGTSQYQNYEPGTIKEFTQSDRGALEASLKGILNSITFASGTRANF